MSQLVCHGWANKCLPDGVSASPQPICGRQSRTKSAGRKDLKGLRPSPDQSSRDIFCLMANFLGLTQKRSMMRAGLSTAPTPHIIRELFTSPSSTNWTTATGEIHTSQLDNVWITKAGARLLKAFQAGCLQVSPIRHRVHPHSSSSLDLLAIHPTPDHSTGLI